jgi:2-keto-4-pentenoate hydratase
MSEETISAARAGELRQTAKELAAARESGVLMDDLGEPLQPVSLAEAYFVHGELASLLGPVGGWKVGAPAADATPASAPMPQRWINLDALTGGTAVIARHRYRGVEAEIAFRVGTALPPRGEKYSREEIVAAMASCHPAIEVLEAAFVNPDTVATKFSQIADLQSNGGFVPGPAVEGWRAIDFAKERVVVTVNGKIEVERVASNSGGTDLLRLVEWLVNVGSASYGGVKAGDWITTGSWTGKTLCASGAEVTVKFSTAGGLKLKFS